MARIYISRHLSEERRRYRVAWIIDPQRFSNDSFALFSSISMNLHSSDIRSRIWFLKLERNETKLRYHQWIRNCDKGCRSNWWKINSIVTIIVSCCSGNLAKIEFSTIKTRFAHASFPYSLSLKSFPFIIDYFILPWRYENVKFVPFSEEKKPREKRKRFSSYFKYQGNLLPKIKFQA